MKIAVTTLITINSPKWIIYIIWRELDEEIIMRNEGLHWGKWMLGTFLAFNYFFNILTLLINILNNFIKTMSRIQGHIV